MKNSTTSCNNLMKWIGISAIDEHGRPVRRTKSEYPYSYDGFVQERCGKNSEATGTVYTDRLLQWNYKNTRRLLRKYFYDGKNEWSCGDSWRDRSAERIGKFLSEWFRRKVRVVLVMEYCNASNGYPIWRIDYAEIKK